MIGRIDQHVSEAEFLDFLRQIYGAPKMAQPITDEQFHMFIESQGVQGPRPPAWQKLVFQIFDTLTAPSKKLRMHAAVTLAREEGADIPGRLLNEVNAGVAQAVSDTPLLRALLNRKNERDKRRSHPLLEYDRYGMKDFDLAITAERHDLAWAIFYVAESRVQQRILEKLNSRARQKENECCE